METLSKDTLKKVCETHKFIVAREKNGWSFGVNCGIIKLKAVQEKIAKGGLTNIISWREVSFQEYITRKIGIGIDPNRIDTNRRFV